MRKLAAVLLLLFTGFAAGATEATPKLSALTAPRPASESSQPLVMYDLSGTYINNYDSNPALQPRTFHFWHASGHRNAPALSVLHFKF